MEPLLCSHQPSHQVCEPLRLYSKSQTPGLTLATLQAHASKLPARGARLLTPQGGTKNRTKPISMQHEHSKHQAFAPANRVFLCKAMRMPDRVAWSEAVGPRPQACSWHEMHMYMQFKVAHGTVCKVEADGQRPYRET